MLQRRLSAACRHNDLQCNGRRQLFCIGTPHLPTAPCTSGLDSSNGIKCEATTAPLHQGRAGLGHSGVPTVPTQEASVEALTWHCFSEGRLVVWEPFHHAGAMVCPHRYSQYFSANPTHNLCLHLHLWVYRRPNPLTDYHRDQCLRPGNLLFDKGTLGLLDPHHSEAAGMIPW